MTVSDRDLLVAGALPLGEREDTAAGRRSGVSMCVIERTSGAGVENEPMRIQVLAVPGLPLVESGDDLAGLIIDATSRAGIGLEHADLVVTTGKVVSKSEGRWVSLNDVHPSERAERLADASEKDPRLVELVLAESGAVVRARPGNLLVRHRRGYVSAVAGIDRSNVSTDEDVVLLLPVDPDTSAAALRASLEARSGVTLGVVISDSHGRPFRIGNTGVAIGAAGLTAVRHLEARRTCSGGLSPARRSFPSRISSRRHRCW